jgi:hypothetical protein
MTIKLTQRVNFDGKFVCVRAYLNSLVNEANPQAVDAPGRVKVKG